MLSSVKLLPSEALEILLVVERSVSLSLAVEVLLVISTSSFSSVAVTAGQYSNIAYGPHITAVHNHALCEHGPIDTAASVN